MTTAPQLSKACCSMVCFAPCESADKMIADKTSTLVVNVFKDSEKKYASSTEAFEIRVGGSFAESLASLAD
jgi:hypothetical protein